MTIITELLRLSYLIDLCRITLKTYWLMKTPIWIIEPQLSIPQPILSLPLTIHSVITELSNQGRLLHASQYVLSPQEDMFPWYSLSLWEGGEWMRCVDIVDCVVWARWWYDNPTHVKKSLIEAYISSSLVTEEHDTKFHFIDTITQ